jgi:hypothetical protein
VVAPRRTGIDECRAATGAAIPPGECRNTSGTAPCALGSEIVSAGRGLQRKFAEVGRAIYANSAGQFEDFDTQ